MQRAFWKSLVLAAALVAGGCDNDIGTTPSEQAPLITDIFTGSINVNGAATHTFLILATGRVTATLNEVLPDNTIPVGFVLGTWNGTTGACQQVIPIDNALQGHILVGEVTGPAGGLLCVRIYDTGKLTASTDYKITVEHP